MRDMLVRVAAVAVAVVLAGTWRTGAGDAVVVNRGQTVQPGPEVLALTADDLLAQAREPVELLAQAAAEPILRQIERTQEQVRAVGRSMLSCVPIGVIQ